MSGDVSNTLSREELAETVERLARKDAGRRGGVLPLLHAIQEELGYIDDDAVPHVAKILNLSRADVHGVITFYPDFRRRPAGRHVIKFCRAESCQARGAEAIEQAIERRLDVAMDATRGDGQVTLEAVYCLGLCASGPNALIDGAPMSRIDANKLDRIAAMVAE